MADRLDVYQSANPESVAKMDLLKSQFPELQQKYPWLSGIGFFGSRTKGTETDIKKSDYDVVIFYNSDRITQVGEASNSDWDDIVNRLETVGDLHLDSRIHRPQDGLRVDISPSTTLKRLGIFLKVAEPIPNKDINVDELVQKAGTPVTQDLYFRFMDVTGLEVLQSRKLVLDELAKNPDGDKYLEILMKCLTWFENKGC